MKNEHTRNWTAALRSGKYTQGTDHLRTVVRNTVMHCCMGVAYEVTPGTVGEDEWRILDLPERSLAEALGMTVPDHHGGYESLSLDIEGVPFTRWDDMNCKDLSVLNDEVGLTFDQIADLIDYFGCEVSSVEITPST